MGNLDPAGPSIGSLDYQTITKIQFIKDKLQGYVGSLGEVPGAAVVKELLQNADDARASIVTFRFCPGDPDYLEVANNSRFSPEDFTNITTILAGQKEWKPGQIGAFGTGFISVYHLTDTPHLHSNRKHVMFDPNVDRLPTYPSDVRDTVFRFPWRRQSTETGRAIGAKTWSDEEIASLKEGLGELLYGLVIFLRSVHTVEVYDAEQLLVRVCRRQRKSVRYRSFIREHWKVVYQTTGGRYWSDTWLYYRTDVGEELAVEGVTPKDFQVSIAFPRRHRDWLTRHVPGMLYNFLPTEIRTGYAFQMNGAFFPDNNRRGILLDTSTHPAKAAWNHAVLRTLGMLLVSAAVDIRQQIQEPGRFYDLLPLDAPSVTPIVAPLNDEFIAAAPSLAFVHTTLRSWSSPVGVKLAGSTDLQRLAEDFLPLLPTSAPAHLRQLLEEKLGASPLTLDHVLDYLEPALQPHTPLDQAPAMIGIRERLEALYHAIAHDWQHASQAPDVAQKDRLKERLKQLPVFLAEDGILHRFDDDLWCGDDDARALSLEGIARFAPTDLQRRFGVFLIPMLEELRGRDLLHYLADKLDDVPEVALPLSPPPINSEERLHAVVRFLDSDRAGLPPGQLAGVPLVLDDDHMVRRASDALRLWTDGHDYDLLRSLGLRFVDREFAARDGIGEFYRHAGVLPAQATDLIARLGATLATGTRWEDAPAPLNGASGLLRLYEYIFLHKVAFDPEHLRAVPLVPTQSGYIAPADGPGGPLLLPMPPGAVDRPVPLALLHLDNVVHEDVLGGIGRGFLAEVLGIATLSPFIAVRDHLLARYHSLPLAHVDRLELLRFVRDVWDSTVAAEREILRPLLAEVPLVRCQDDHYRTGPSTYFPSDELSVMMPGGYPQLHADYPNEWSIFFDAIGVRRHPSPQDLLRAVEETIQAGPPIDSRLGTIDAVYRLLQREVGREYQDDDPVLARLRTISWLPARQNYERWFSPAELHLRTFEPLIGEDFPLLSLPDPVPPVSRLLGLPTRPAIELIVDHLRKSRVRGAKVDERAYAFLAAHATTGQLAELRDEPIFWDRRAVTYRPAKAMIVGDYEPRFGARRGFVRPDDNQTRALLAALGDARDPGWEESLRILEEIGHDYASDAAVPPDEQELLVANFDYLGRQVQAFAAMARDCREHLRSQPIFLTQRGRLAPIESPGALLKLPAAAGTGSRAVPLDVLKLDSLLHSDLLGTAPRRFLTEVLGVEELDPHGAVRDYVLFRYHDEQVALTDDERLTLLRFVRDVWEDLSGEQREALRPQLEATRLIHCQDDCYRTGAEVYLRSDELDGIFVDGYARPHERYPGTWREFLAVLGARRYPTTADLVREVERTVMATRPDASRVKAVEGIYQLLNDEYGDGRRYRADEHLAKLANLEWVPARIGGVFSGTWHTPSEVYQEDRGPLVGARAPVLGFSKRTTEALRMVLQMPDWPPVALVLEHLFASVDEGLTRRVARDVYHDLGRRWHEITPEARARLQGDAVFWHDGRFWAGRDIFLEDHRRFFGGRRLYLRNLPDHAPLAFLRGIGARPEPDPWDDHVALLIEISETYDGNRPVTREDSQLLLRNFDHLGRQARSAEGPAAAPELAGLALVPGQDGRLYAPGAIVLVDDSQRATLERFEASAVPFLDQNELDGVGLTEHAEHFLRTVLCVAPIDALVSRYLAGSPPGLWEDEQITQRLRSLSNALRRIAKTIREQRNDHTLSNSTLSNSTFEQLDTIRCYTCSQLPIEYVLDNGAGWRIIGERAEEPALYVEERAALYLRQRPTSDGRRQRISRLHLARELESLLFPQSKESVVIERLLSMTPDEAEHYLTRHGYRSLFADEVVLADDELEDESDEWGAQEDDFAHQNNEVSEDGASKEASPSAQSSLIGAPPRSPESRQQPASDMPPDTTETRRESSNAGSTFERRERIHRDTPQGGGSSGNTSGWQPECSPEEAEIRGEMFQETDMRRASGAGHRTRQGMDDGKDESEAGLSQRERDDIGEWGERYALRYLAKEYREKYVGGTSELSANSFSIRCEGRTVVVGTWLNAGMDLGKGHDIRIEEGTTCHHIEVKSTKTEAKAEINLSGAQWDLAQGHDGPFYICRVYNAGTLSARAVLIPDPMRLWQEDAISIVGIRIRI